MARSARGVDRPTRLPDAWHRQDSGGDRGSLITEGLDWLTRLQANYENGEIAINEARSTIAELDALAAGTVPEEE